MININTEPTQQHLPQNRDFAGIKLILVSSALMGAIIQCGQNSLLTANQKPSMEMENEEKIRLEARRRLEEQLKQYRVQRHKERVSDE